MIVSIPLLAAFLLQTASTVLAEVTVTTVAGSGQRGHIDAWGESARFNYPLGIAIDRNGTILVTEKYRNYLRKIDTRGMVSTFPRYAWIGRGIVRGLCSGQHAIAGIATDGDGNVYMADWGGSTIKKLNPQGQCSTLAGSGESGSDDGTAMNATFQSPLNVAVNPAGNVYVADKVNSRIRKITPDGMVSSLAEGVVRGIPERISRYSMHRLQHGIVVNVDGYVYVADTGRHRIRRVSPDGIVETFAGTGARGYRNGPANRAMFNKPVGIVAAADGTLYVADTGNHRIRKITLDGRVSTIAGSGDYGQWDTIGSAATFHRPMGIAIDADGNLLVTDTGNHAIRKITFSSNGESDDFDIDDLSDGDDDVDYDADENAANVYDMIVSPAKLRDPVPPRPINYDVDECAICYDVKSKDQKFDYCSIGCGHSFHKQCIKKCMAHAVRRKCPMCREQWVMNKPAIDIPSAGSELSTDESSFASSASPIETRNAEPNLVET